MRAEEKVEFLTPLTIAAVRDSFRDEFGSEVQLEMNDDGLSLIGPGWEAFHVDGASHLYIMCSWALPKDQVALTKLVRAGMRGGCFVFDPQSQDCGTHHPNKTLTAFDSGTPSALARTRPIPKTTEVSAGRPESTLLKHGGQTRAPAPCTASGAPSREELFGTSFGGRNL